MPWCPKCRIEYRQDFKTCSDCNIELVDELEQITESSSQDYDKEAYLTTVSNSVEAEVIEALLKSNGIPVLKKFREAGGYLDIYMGATNLGIDLYVPSKLLEEAKNIIESNQEIDAEEDRQNTTEEDISEFDEKYKEKQRIRAWIILLIFIPGLLWIVITVLYNVYHWILR